MPSPIRGVGACTGHTAYTLLVYPSSCYQKLTFLGHPGGSAGQASNSRFRLRSRSHRCASSSPASSSVPGSVEPAWDALCLPLLLPLSHVHRLCLKINKLKKHKPPHFPTGNHNGGPLRGRVTHAGPTSIRGRVTQARPMVALPWKVFILSPEEDSSFPHSSGIVTPRLPHSCSLGQNRAQR